MVLNIDGTSNGKGAGIGIILVTPEGSIIEQSFTLGFPASNNEVEYEVVLAGTKRLLPLESRGSKFAVNSSLKYIARDSQMADYLQLVLKLKSKILRYDFKWVPKSAIATQTHLPTWGQLWSSSSGEKSPSSTSLIQVSSNRRERSYASTPHRGGEVPSFLT